MIRVFYGEDRVRAQQEIAKCLGADYEVIDCADLTEQDLPSIFLGTTFFDTSARHILLRDFTANKQIADHLGDYQNTPHEIILLETKLDKRSTLYKSLKDKLEFKEFAPPVVNKFSQLSDIYRTAKKDGPAAVKLLKKVEPSEDPIMFFGFLVSQALKDFSLRPEGAREKQILKKLAAVDLQMKSTATEPWLLVESALLGLSEQTSE